eukprot:1673145-Rhodomonas_salina.2
MLRQDRAWRSRGAEAAEHAIPRRGCEAEGRDRAVPALAQYRTSPSAPVGRYHCTLGQYRTWRSTRGGPPRAPVGPTPEEGGRIVRGPATLGQYRTCRSGTRLCAAQEGIDTVCQYWTSPSRSVGGAYPSTGLSIGTDTVCQYRTWRKEAYPRCVGVRPR